MNQDHVFIVANSHIDPVWLWDKYEGIDEVLNTFASVCDRLDEYPELRFSASSICFYKWVEMYTPDVFARVKAHVDSGRWEITGGWWVETDCNLPLKESFVKSAQLSKDFVQSRFGVDVPVAFSPDSFGHPAPLPEILADSGFKYYIFSRPSAEEMPELPSNLFYWEHNGKRVLCYRLKGGYTQNFMFNEQGIEDDITQEESLINGIRCFLFGMGDHGGGPTILEIETLKRIIARHSEMDIHFSTCLDFFKEAEKLPDIPVFSGDLHRHAVGCYSVNRNIKNSIRSAERALCYTQRVIDAAGETDCLSLDDLWGSTVFNQFHDIMPGSCSPDAAKQATDELGGVKNSCGEISYRMLNSIAQRTPVECRQGEFRIFNSLPQSVTGPFEIESFLYFREGAPFKDSSGRIIELQNITPSVYCINRRWMFIDTIPANSEKSYCFETEAGPTIGVGENSYYSPGKSVSLGQFTLESPGQISDTGSNRPLIKSPIALAVLSDQSDTWSHGIHGYGPSQSYFTEESSSICNGSLASFMLTRFAFGHSSAEAKFTVYQGLPWVDLSLKVNWEEKQSILKLEITPIAAFDSFEVQGPGAPIRKTTNEIEEPLHGWIKFSDLVVLQDGAFSLDRWNDKIRITLIRSSIYGYDKNWIIDRCGPVAHTDQGEHEFRFRFFLNVDMITEQIDSALAAFVEPFRVVRYNCG